MPKYRVYVSRDCVQSGEVHIELTVDQVSSVVNENDLRHLAMITALQKLKENEDPYFGWENSDPGEPVAEDVEEMEQEKSL